MSLFFSSDDNFIPPTPWDIKNERIGDALQNLGGEIKIKGCSRKTLGVLMGIMVDIAEQITEKAKNGI